MWASGATQALPPSGCGPGSPTLRETFSTCTPAACVASVGPSRDMKGTFPYLSPLTLAKRGPIVLPVQWLL